MNKNLEAIKLIAETEYSSIVEYSFFLDYKLRIILVDKSFVDINVSTKLKDKFGFHWETKNKLNEIYRYDNFPDPKWSNLESFPFHFHFKIQDNVIASPFSRELFPGFRGFMNFAKDIILSKTK